MAAEFAFNPSQPRDERGRWTTGGGGGRTVEGIGDVDAYLEATPQLPGEPIFVWHGRLVDGLDPVTKHALLFEIRERCEVVEYIADGMKQWREQHGLPEPQVDISTVPADQLKSHVVARYFETHPDQSSDPKVQAAFAEFHRQSEEMYEFMTRPESEGGMGITVSFWETDDPANFGDGPYPDATAQAADLRDNRHIFLESGLGGDHSTLSREQYDRFRAVHDVFGHAGIGSGFDRHGEYQAYLAHASMYYGDGRRAMASEYHGVNAAAWSGAPGTPGTGKSIIMPETLIENPWDDTGALRPLPSPEQLRPYLPPDEDLPLVASAARLTELGVTADTAKAIRELVDRTGMDHRVAQMYDQHPFHNHAVDEDAEFAFNPSQPRDDSGRWTSGGGSAGEQRITATAESDALAAPIAAAARAAEPAVTARITGLAEARGGEMYGLDFRLKAEDKISEKIERGIVEMGYTHAESAANIRDAIRYTVHFDEDAFGDAAQGVIDTLRADGNRLVVKNTWPPEKGSSYKGVNVNVYQPDGLVYEVQFHTPASQAVKDRMHLLYQQQRVLPPSDPRWAQLESEMLSIGTQQPVPRDAERVFRLAAEHRPRPRRRVFPVARDATVTAEVAE